MPVAAAVMLTTDVRVAMVFVEVIRQVLQDKGHQKIWYKNQRSIA
jgi:hypothetical protein